VHSKVSRTSLREMFKAETRLRSRAIKEAHDARS
jgi:hypothetical protein